VLLDRKLIVSGAVPAARPQFVQNGDHIGHLFIVPMLACCVVDNKAYVNQADEHGWTPLMHAAKSGNCAIAEALLSLGKQVDTTQCNHSGHSAIDIAMFYRHRDVYALLTKFGMLTLT